MNNPTTERVVFDTNFPGPRAKLSTIPVSSIPIINQIFVMGKNIENENVRRLWELLKDGAFGIETSVTRDQAMQKLFGNDPGSCARRLKEIRNRTIGKTVFDLFVNFKTNEEMYLEGEMRFYINSLAGAVRGLGVRLRGIGTDILSFTDGDDVLRYTIPLSENARAIARSNLKNEAANIRARINNLDKLKDLV